MRVQLYVGPRPFRRWGNSEPHDAIQATPGCNIKHLHPDESELPYPTLTYPTLLCRQQYVDLQRNAGGGKTWIDAEKVFNSEEEDGSMLESQGTIFVEKW